MILIYVLYDGTHHVLNRLDSVFHHSFYHFVSSPANAKLLGFEVQKFLASSLAEDYDYYCYLEDDLLIHDTLFFDKLHWFKALMGDSWVSSCHNELSFLILLILLIGFILMVL